MTSIYESIAPWSKVFGKLRPKRQRIGSGPILRPGDASSLSSMEDVTDQGERCSPEKADFCYYAHLSLYSFAKPFAIGQRVLDAGCGTGYGSHYLIRAGARSVLGIDLSQKAINYCRSHYSAKGLHYEAMYLQDLRLKRHEPLDLIFCSNVMEHVSDPDAFLTKAIRLLTREGVFVLAVPPITTRDAYELNLLNSYHINNITPSGWLTKMRRYFREVHGYRHCLEPEWCNVDGKPIDRTRIRETDFTVTEKPDAEILWATNTITTVLVARYPRAHPLPSTTNEAALPTEWKAEEMLRYRQIPKGVLGTICGDHTVSQSFRCETDRLRRIDVFMATYARINSSVLEFSLEGEGVHVEQHRIVLVPASQIADNSWHSFEFAPIEGALGREFVFELKSPDADQDNGVTAYYSDSSARGAKHLKINQRAQPGCLIFKTYGSS